MILTIGILLAALLLLWVLAVRCRVGHPAWPELRQYRYAHRGLHNEQRPENALSAFRAAAAAGFGAELDVHLSSDGQLVVMHDSETARLCGENLVIEDSRWDQLRTLRLGGTEETIPLLTDVLPLFDGGTPLVIELKTRGNNAAALCQAVFAVLDEYRGSYCMESFDPRVLLWLRKHRPDVCRGQLAVGVYEKGLLPWWQRFCLSNLLMNFLTVPDFIAYNHETRRRTGSLAICRRIWRVQEISWTVRSEAVMREMEALDNLVIFEQFAPKPQAFSQ